jgi:hypothetical protein
LIASLIVTIFSILFFVSAVTGSFCRNLAVKKAVTSAIIIPNSRGFSAIIFMLSISPPSYLAVTSIKSGSSKYASALLRAFINWRWQLLKIAAFIACVFESLK